MAKNKGKSRRRKQSWDHLHNEQAHEGVEGASWGSLTRRKVKLRGQKEGQGIFAGSEDGQQETPGGAADDNFQRITGMVVQLYPAGAWVQTAEYGKIMCGLAGTFRPSPNASALAVGDNVSIALLPATVGDISAGNGQIDGDRVDALIEQRHARSSVLSRPQPMRGKWRDQYDCEVFEKVLAANIDQLVVVCAVSKPPLRRRMLDRFLIIAQRSELELKLLINKTDLGEVDTELLSEYEQLGVVWQGCSATTGENIDKITELLSGKISVLAGSSGVGKSSLLNAMAPQLELVTRQVREKDKRGRHTTTAATMYELPFGKVIDTPGVRELGIEISPTELPWYFPEIAEIAPQCKFRNCTHTHEPQCAVRAASEAGQLSHRRYDSYLRILESMGQ